MEARGNPAFKVKKRASYTGDTNTHPMRVIEVTMEQCRDERAGQTGDPRKNPPTSGIVRDDPPCSPSTKSNRVQFLVGLPLDVRMWASCRTMPLIGGYPRGSPVCSTLSSPYSPQSPSSALKTSLLCAATLSSHGIRRGLPAEYREPLHSTKITAWCVMSSFWIIGFLFHEDRNGQRVIVSAERHSTLHLVLPNSQRSTDTRDYSRTERPDIQFEYQFTALGVCFRINSFPGWWIFHDW
ncbi:hypothetical protein PR048_017733 [Dryococelus australis]|uniref:Uncharacterized protein n=1 Tax=Dryococelus australis TaxID=614101 RepID=A0ABQ9HAE8_9NEOP|nr:hypothetical protein PR048_017733 [Dryococelus australis]